MAAEVCDRVESVDGAKELPEYGRTWNIDPSGCTFQEFCDLVFYPDEGQFIRSLHTLIIDRQGK